MYIHAGYYGYVDRYDAGGKKCGLVASFTRTLRPVIHILFPDIPRSMWLMNI